MDMLSKINLLIIPQSILVLIICLITQAVSFRWRTQLKRYRETAAELHSNFYLNSRLKRPLTYHPT